MDNKSDSNAWIYGTTNPPRNTKRVRHEEDGENMKWFLREATFLQPQPSPDVSSSYVLSTTITATTTLRPLAQRSRPEPLRFSDLQQYGLPSPPPQQQIHPYFVENAIGVLRDLSHELYNLEEENLRLKKQQKKLDEQIGALQKFHDTSGRITPNRQHTRKRRYSDLVSVVLHERDLPAFMPFVLHRGDEPFIVAKPMFIPGVSQIKLIGLAFSPALCKIVGFAEVSTLHAYRLMRF